MCCLFPVETLIGTVIGNITQKTNQNIQNGIRLELSAIFKEYRRNGAMGNPGQTVASWLLKLSLMMTWKGKVLGDQVAAELDFCDNNDELRDYLRDYVL